MNDYLRHIGVSLSFVNLRRLKGAFEVMLFDARAERAAAESMRSIVAATEIVHQLEEAVARCREVLEIKRSMIGWPRPWKHKGKRKGSACSPAPAPASHAYRLIARCSTVDGPRRGSAEIRVKVGHSSPETLFNQLVAGFGRFVA